ncbi:deoxyribodipyrimidine photolyase [Ectothiorhodospira shaposhnikovii]|uniref:cryptochrome/photolyase family protein n=1 Tax=Ectothiorhodospira shaposhnikovii TaxID=1054 RepID=UPI001903725F|nr:deoxyribodipyrimidine photo-lyase [Ectothiorhodospira shaposhnikovii]MBK1672214.1 deoxyribodipyrimidine photolyase [Ectothiorhodospira shaposhnikovii]
MKPILLWLRRDLRLADNPALSHALRTGRPVIPVHIHAPEEEAPWPPGAASRWWLHHSLTALSRSLEGLGSRLTLRRGPSLEALLQLIHETEAEQVVWNRVYEPVLMERDQRIKAALKDRGLVVESFNSALLFEPWTVRNKSGEPYRVFTPFWKACCAMGLPDDMETRPEAITAPAHWPGSELLERFNLLPRIPWDQGMAACWQPGEEGAHRALERFLSGAILTYKTHRDLPGQPGTSRMSPHLHFGEIGPRQLIRACRPLLTQGAGASGTASVEAFMREIGWREFAFHLLFHFPHTPEQPLDGRFADFPWRAPRDYETELQAWRQGRTGIPLVDAGMRELWHTGWMHNRVRMITASLLVKNLRIPWQTGARWFWDTLVDADLASNTLGWQWTAGCGADAAPYFRVFNPVLQGERFDGRGDYIRRWVPELKRLPDSYLQAPWNAPAGLLPGADYPRPLVDLGESRKAALAAWEQLKGAERSGT